MKTKVLVRAPVLTSTGYGEHSRFVLRSLRTLEEKLEIFLMPVNWGLSNWIWEDNEERAWFDLLVKKTIAYQQQGGAYDVSIQVTIPNEWQPIAPINIGVTAGIETTKVSPIWLEKANMMTKVITISDFSKNIFLGTSYEGVNKQTGQPMVLKCTAPIDVVHYPVKKYETQNINLDLTTDFNFLTVAQWGPRKNVGATIQWFVEEFCDNPEVGLVVKTFVKGGSRLDRESVENQITRLLALPDYKDRQCKVYLLHGDLTEEEMHSLYVHPKMKAYVSLSHGEGFGLPHFESAYSGLPVIAPDWSGYLDFLYMPTETKKGKRRRTKSKPHFAQVGYDLSPVHPDAVWEGVIEKDSMWCYPQQGSYKMKLREVYKNHERFKKQARVLQKWILKEFERDNQYEKFNDALSSYFTPTSDLDVEAWFKEIGTATDIKEYE